MIRGIKALRTFAVLLLFLLSAGIAAANDHYVSPSGQPSGDGSINNPWDLQTALNQPSSVQPGDNIWLLGGTYVSTNGGFASNLNGTATNPIIVRNYNGQRATIDGQLNSMALDVVGSYTWFWGLEIMSSCTQRVLTEPTGICAVGVGAYGPDDKYIDLVVHDTTQGFSGFNASPDNEFYGNLVYYNGFVGPNRNYGHGMYLQNDTGTKTVSENFVGDNADEGIQIYGSGNADLINFTVTGNTLYNTSSWPTPNYQYNLIIAGGATRKNITVENNYSYFPAGGTFGVVGGEAAQLGQYTSGQDMTVTNNVFANGYAPLNFTNQTGPVVFTGNTVVAGTNALRPATLDVYSGQSFGAYTWDDNTYYDQSYFQGFYVGYSADGSDFSGVNTSFAGWQSETGFDTHSTYQQSAPTGTWVYVQPNKYEAKRANVTIFNWDSLPAVFVDLSTVLNPGDQYVIQDAQNFYGPTVETGTYSGDPVAIKMTGLTKATPVGFAAPAHTAPILGTFIVLAAGGTATDPTPPVTTPPVTTPPVTPPVTTTPTPVAPTASVAFVRSDATTEGNWQTAYGSGGYVIAQGPTSNPASATFAVANQSTWTWTANTTDPRALATGSGSARLAAAWFNSSAFSLTMNVTGGTPQQFSLYALDWDAKGRLETIQVVDTGTGDVLDTRTISSFANGVYLVWNISGSVTINISATGGPNAVVSGVFFGAGTSNSGSGNGAGNSGGTATNNGSAGTAASFVISDTVTQGSWQGKYGADGYAVAGVRAQDTPIYAPFSLNGAGEYTWAANITDLRAPETPGQTGGTAAAWFNSSSFTLNVNFTDGNTHQFALYAMDWDSKGRAETVQIANATTGTVLDTRTLSGFTNGIYLVWNVSGSVTITVTARSGPNAVMSGVFFGTGTANTDTSATATFISTDTTTQGSWTGVYGKDAFDIPNTNAKVLPPYATFTPQNQANYTWTSNATAIQDLQAAGNTSARQASCWYTGFGASYTLDLNITDGNAHMFELYALDWDSRRRAETIQVTDATSGALLDTRTVTNFSQGIYYIWKVTGHVMITVTVISGPNAVISGAFFD